MTSLPLILETVVACLLVVTVVYCIILEKRMRTFRNDHAELRSLIAELDGATGRAERAVVGLSETTKEAQQALDERMNDARALTRSLSLLSRTTSKHGGTRSRDRAGSDQQRARTEKAPDRGNEKTREPAI